MKTFPMFLRVTGRRIVIVGGGEQAAQKCRLVLKTEARIVVAAQRPEPEIAGLAAAGQIALERGPLPGDLFTRAALVFAATGCRGADAAAHALAQASGALMNVVDAPELCDAFTPSLVDRDPVVAAIGTEGTAPVLARQIKTRIEESLEPNLGDLAALAAGRRRRAAEPGAPPRTLVLGVLRAPRAAHSRGDEARAARLIKGAIASGGPPGDRAGFVSFVGAGPGSRDLITLRGVRRLQEADVILYDRLVAPSSLELARLGAERIYVGKSPGTTPGRGAASTR